MSGSTDIENDRIIGILVGGPPLPGQYELVFSAQCMYNGDYVAAWGAYHYTFQLDNYQEPALLDSRILVLFA